MTRCLPPLLRGAVTLGAVKTVILPGVGKLLTLATYSRAGRLDVHALPPGTVWELCAPTLAEARTAEKAGNAAAVLACASFTVRREGFRDAPRLRVPGVRVLRELLEALETYEGTTFPALRHGQDAEGETVPTLLPPSPARRSA